MARQEVFDLAKSISRAAAWSPSLIDGTISMVQAAFVAGSDYSEEERLVLLTGAFYGVNRAGVDALKRFGLKLGVITSNEFQKLDVGYPTFRNEEQERYLRWMEETAPTFFGLAR